MEATPIQRFSYLDNTLYFKREDLLPFSFGGNKARKASLFFQEIDAQHADYVVTYGSGSSNHCRVVANMAAARHLPCLIISPQEAEKDTFNRKLMRLFGAQIVTCPVSKVAETIEAHLLRLKQEGFHPYFIQGGGHGNIGTQAYIECFREISLYEECSGIHFDYIFLASGTGTTQAGLVCGKLLTASNVRIIGISIARKNPYGRDVVLRSVSDYLGAKFPYEIYDSAVEFIDAYITGGYGVSSEEINQCIKQVLLQWGIPMNSTYTGKAFFGMERYIAENKIRGKSILFLHTGGAPLFFDDIGEMMK